MRTTLRIALLTVFLAIAASLALATPLPGTVLVAPGASVVPGDATGQPAGTLLASLTETWSFSTTAGTTSGTFITAVFRNSSGTLDFYYQVSNGPSSSTSLARESNTSFSGFQTSVGFRTDGSSVPGGLFADGTVIPNTADRNTSGAVVGFNFNIPVTNEIAPGQTSFVLVISTNATNFTQGNSEMLDGGSVTVNAFQPAVPEPSSLLLFGSGLVTLAGVLRRKLS